MGVSHGTVSLSCLQLGFPLISTVHSTLLLSLRQPQSQVVLQHLSDMQSGKSLIKSIRRT